MYDDVQDRIWEMEKSWRNNLIFHGVRYDDPNVEEDPNRTEEKVRTVIKVDLQLSRDIPILRAYRIRNGPLVKGTHPILGWLYVVLQIHNDFFIAFNRKLQHVFFARHCIMIFVCLYFGFDVTSARYPAVCLPTVGRAARQ